MPECSRTARILDQFGVDLQGVAQLIYNNNTSPSPGFFGPTSASRTLEANDPLAYGRE